MIEDPEIRRRLEAWLATQPKVPLYMKLFFQAHSYHEAALLVQEQIKIEPNMTAPAILCRTFGIEILLKCFIVLPFPNVIGYRELHPLKVHLRGHSYSALWDRIHGRLRREIVATFSDLTRTPMSEDGFRAKLIEVGDDAFKHWRYIYEQESNQYLNSALFAQIADALGLAAQREINIVRGRPPEAPITRA